jgi:hypothetical protein
MRPEGEPLASNIEELYRLIKPLPREDRLELLARVAAEVGDPEGSEIEHTKTRDIMQLHGLGKELWEGVNADQYVNELRREWTNLPE